MEVLGTLQKYPLVFLVRQTDEAGNEVYFAAVKLPTRPSTKFGQLWQATKRRLVRRKKV